MARPQVPEVRRSIVERAAALLRAREQITLRSLVAGADVSTMAVYTYFGGVDGVWRAVRQEGFTRLAAKLAAVPETRDPVADLTAQLSAYAQHALDDPDLYRVMFDATADLDDTQAADATLERIVEVVRRCRDRKRFRDEVDPLEFATQCWMLCHGIVSLIAIGPLAIEQLDHAPAMLHAQFVGAGDHPDACHASIANGWVSLAARTVRSSGGDSTNAVDGPSKQPRPRDIARVCPHLVYS